MVGGFGSDDPQARKSGFWEVRPAGTLYALCADQRPAVQAARLKVKLTRRCTDELSRRPEGTGVTVNGLDREFGLTRCECRFGKRARRITVESH